jgi:dihydroorotase
MRLPGGTLAVGGPADISCFHLERETVYSREMIVSRSKNSPFIGKRLAGFAEWVLCGGRIVLRNGVVAG